MILPAKLVGPEPHKDMPEDVRQVYEQARGTAAHSPAAAAALLRKGIEMLCKHLDPGDKSLADRIKKLHDRRQVSKGGVDALEIVRVIGNEMVHPGEIDFDEGECVVPKLMNVFNQFVKEAIEDPAVRENAYRMIPADSQGRVRSRHKWATGEKER